MMSKSGLCQFCGAHNVEVNNQQMRAKNGPAYNLYLHRWSTAGEHLEQSSQLLATEDDNVSP